MVPYTAYSDEELADLLKNEDRLAFKELYSRFWGLLHRHGMNIMKNEEEVNDILQEVFLALWIKAPQLHLTSTLSAYLYASVRNRIFDHLDKSKSKDKYIASLAEYMKAGDYTTDNLLLEREMAELIEKEIATLPEKMRQVFELSRKSNLSYREIGDRLGIADSTVKNQISKAIKILRIKFGPFILLYLLLSPAERSSTKGYPEHPIQTSIIN